MTKSSKFQHFRVSEYMQVLSFNRNEAELYVILMCCQPEPSAYSAIIQLGGNPDKDPQTHLERVQASVGWALTGLG